MSILCTYEYVCVRPHTRIWAHTHTLTCTCNYYRSHDHRQNAQSRVRRLMVSSICARMHPPPCLWHVEVWKNAKWCPAKGFSDLFRGPPIPLVAQESHESALLSGVPGRPLHLPGALQGFQDGPRRPPRPPRWPNVPPRQPKIARRGPNMAP